MTENKGTSDDADARELRRLVCRLLDEPSDATASALADLLFSRPDLQDEYLGIMQCEAALDEIHARHAVAELQSVVEADSILPGEAIATPSPARSLAPNLGPAVFPSNASAIRLLLTSRLRRSRGIVWAVAATVAAIAAGYLLRTRDYATLIAADGVDWATGTHCDVGARLGNEWIELREGSIQLAYDAGAAMKIEAPSRFRVAGRLRCEVARGSAVVFVPPLATGFAVETPELRAVDVGTSFRVDVAATGMSTVHVLDGVVDVIAVAGGAERRLQAGDLAVADDSGSHDISFIAGDARQPITSNRIAYRAKHPPALGPHGFRGNDRCYVFLERAAFQLPHDLPVNCVAAGPHIRFADIEGTLRAGEVVDCYLVHCAPIQARNVVAGMITFQGEILGVISSSDRLNATNDLFGSPWTLICQHPERGLETAPDQNADRLGISADRRTLSIDLRTSTLDQVRVLVRTTSP